MERKRRHLVPRIVRTVPLPSPLSWAPPLSPRRRHLRAAKVHRWHREASNGDERGAGSPAQPADSAHAGSFSTGSSGQGRDGSGGVDHRTGVDSNSLRVRSHPHALSTSRLHFLWTNAASSSAMVVSQIKSSILAWTAATQVRPPQISWTHSERVTASPDVQAAIVVDQYMHPFRLPPSSYRASEIEEGAVATVTKPHEPSAQWWRRLFTYLTGFSSQDILYALWACGFYPFFSSAPWNISV